MSFSAHWAGVTWGMATGAAFALGVTLLVMRHNRRVWELTREFNEQWWRDFAELREILGVPRRK